MNDCRDKKRPHNPWLPLIARSLGLVFFIVILSVIPFTQSTILEGEINTIEVSPEGLTVGLNIITTIFTFKLLSTTGLDFSDTLLLPQEGWLVFLRSFISQSEFSLRDSSVSCF